MKITPRDILQLTKEAGKNWSEDNASRLAAALAYYTMVSLAPLLVLSVVVLGWFVKDSKKAGDIVAEQMGHLVGSVGSSAAVEMVSAAKHSNGLLATIISLIVVIFGASGVFGELQGAMNTIWGVKLKPGLGILVIIRKRFLSLAMVFGVCFLLLVSLVVSTTLTAVSSQFSGGSSVVAYIVDLLGSIIVVTLLFAMIFKFLPDVNVGWRDVGIGAGLTALLFTLGKVLLGIYLSKGSTASAYGAAGSLAALLIWIYYSAQIMFFGSEFTKAYASKFGSRVEPDEEAIGITNEMRAQQGIPKQQAVSQAMNYFQDKQKSESAPPSDKRAMIAAVAGFSGVAMGLVFGSLKPGGRKQKVGNRAARALHLKERLDTIEQRIEEAKAMMESPRAARDASRRWARDWKRAGVRKPTEQAPWA